MYVGDVSAPSKTIGKERNHDDSTPDRGGRSSLAWLAAACGSPAEDSGFVQTDSAGVTILESFDPAWDEEKGWTVAAEPELAIGAGVTGGDDPNHPPFGSIRGDVSVLSNGSLVVGDNSISEVMVFDTLGQLTHRFGGKGDGPRRIRPLRNGVDLRGGHDRRDGSLCDQFLRFGRPLHSAPGDD